MAHPNTHRLLASLGLLLLFLLPPGIREAHLLFEPHETQPDCHAEGSDRHFHSEEYAHHDCPFCLFHYTQYQEAEAATALSHTLNCTADPLPSYSFFFNHLILGHIRERGPPAGFGHSPHFA